MKNVFLFGSCFKMKILVKKDIYKISIRK